MTGEDIETIYREMELELISSMKRNLSRHLKEEKKVGFEFEQWQAATLKEFKRFQKENKSIIGNYTSSLDKDIQETFQNELKKGSKKEFSKYKKIMGDKFKANDNLRGSFFKLNDRKIKGLIKSTNSDLSAANKACFRMANDQFRKTIIKSVMFSNHGVVSPKKAIDMATKDFLSNGLKTIQYKDGRRVNIASYAKMAVRTGNQRAQLIGEGQFRKEIGEHLVQITSHGGTCKLCSKWEGKVLIDDVYSGGSKKDGKYPLLSTAMNQGLFHPNCECGLPTYYKELEELEQEINSANDSESGYYQEELNCINQNIHKYQRLEAGSLDEENIEKYSHLKRKYENKKSLLTDSSLTYDERYAINKYIGPDSYVLNDNLRNGISLSDSDKKIINNLDSALNKMNNYEGNVTRSLSLSSDDVDYFMKDYKVGNIIEYPAYTSTTIGETYNPEARVQFFIKSKHGKNIIKYNESEQEILFKRNSKFKVKDIKYIDDFYIHIKLEEIE